MNTLIIKNISEELTYNDREELFRHFGAQSVTNRPNYSFAVFINEFKSREAMSRLHQLSVYGKRLRVEFVASGQSSLVVNQLPALNEPHIRQRQTEERIETLKETKIRHFLNQLNYVSPALGLNYLPSPLLKYRYPSATPQIVSRICRTLLSHPRFYTQVLHLMNKMSLPVPFETSDSPDSSSDLIDFTITETNVKKRTKNDLSSDESELELSDNEDKRQRFETIVVKPNKRVIKKLRTGFVGEKAVDLSKKFEPKRKQRTKSTEVLPKVFDLAKICDQKTNITVNIVSDSQTLNQKCDTDVQQVSGQSSGFGVISGRTQKQTELTSDIVWNKCDVITDEELTQNRISINQWPQYSVFKNYSPGQQSVRLYIKNIDKRVETKDLMKIYSKFIDLDSDEHKNMFDIRLMKTGRMKGQAFITFPNEMLAEKALNETNGYLFNEKPIVVCFALSRRPSL